MTFSLEDFVHESNRIEGIIHRYPTPEELLAHNAFLAAQTLSIVDLTLFVDTVAGASLRVRTGQNVRVGDHYPPPGGQGILYALDDIIAAANAGGDPYHTHHRYETLHPFMDGNGRSGRVLWLWMMGGIDRVPLGFLHTWYYQSLKAGR